LWQDMGDQVYRVLMLKRRLGPPAEEEKPFSLGDRLAVRVIDGLGTP
jgi:hypothetical protein